MADEFSQDDIDALLNQGGAGDAANAGAPDTAADSSGAGEDIAQAEIDALINATTAQVAEDAGANRVATAQPEVVARPVRFASLSDEGTPADTKNMDFIMDVALKVSVELGRTKMLVKDVLQLGMGSVVELNKLSGEPVDVLLNGKLIAHGEVVVVDENFGVKIVDVISPEKRMKNVS